MSKSLKDEAREFTERRQRDTAYERDKKARQREGSWIEALEVTRRGRLVRALKLWGVLHPGEESDRQAMDQSVAAVLDKWADEVLGEYGE